MKIPKSNQYKRINNKLWVFYTFFVIVIASIAYLSIDEMNKMSVISNNYRTMNKVYFITDEILSSPSEYNSVKENLESLNVEVDKLDLLYSDENQKLINSVHTKIGELELVLQDTSNPNLTNDITKTTQSIKLDSRGFVQNILMKEHSTLSQTQKIVLILIVISIIVLTLVLILVILPAVRRLDKLVIKLAKTSREKEESLKELTARNKEIYYREKRFSTIAELSPIGLFLTDMDGKCLFVNQRYSDIVGVRYEDCLDDNWKYSVYEGDRDRMLESWTASVRNNENYFIDEYRIIKNDELRDIAVKAKPIKDENGEITGFVGMIEDITTAKEIQSELEDTAERFEAFIDDLPYGAVLNGDDGLYFNKAVEKIIGYTNDEIKTIEDWFSYLYKENSSEIRQLYEENRGKDFDGEVLVEVISKSGELRKVAFKDKMTSIGEIWGLEDRTELLRAEAEKSEVNQEYSFILDSIKIGVWDWTIESNSLEWNERMYKIFDFEEGKTVSSYDDYKDKLHPDDVDRVNKEIANVLNTPDTEFDSVFRIVIGNEEIRYIRAVSKTYRDDNGNAVRIVGLNWDVTEAKRSEEIRKELSEKYELILNSTEIGVWDWDFGTNQLSWNDIMYRLFEVSKDSEDVYAEYEEKLHPDDKEKASKNLERIISGEIDHYESEFRIILTDQSIKHLRSITNIEKDKDGKVIRIYGINQDITEEKISEEERKELAEKYELILNTTAIGVWDWDFRNNKLSWNDTMYVLFDVPTDSADVYKDYEKRLHPADKVFAQSTIEKILGGEIEHSESEFRIITREGNTRHIKAITNIEKDENNTIIRLYGINLDISELKEHQEQLIDAKEKAETANRAKSTFLANMSHEIRTPMNAILGFGEILQNNNKDERNQDYITGIIKSGNSLLSLINDILDFSKIEANKMTLNLNSVDIKRIISDIDRIFEFTASKKGIQYYSNIEMNIPPYLILDEGKIKQILINLLGNAIKFTESGSISLDVNFSFNEKDTSKIQLTFAIKDSGIGIDQDKLNSIFNAFEQEDDNDSRKYEGTGLGLSIVKSIVELKNGTVEVESKLGKGSTFIVTIPDVSISLMRPNQISQSTKIDFSKYDLSDKTVLFAEDIESNRNVVKGFLKDYAIKVLFAHNGAEALIIARTNKIDLAFIDLHMPIMDGMTMAEIWTNDDELKSIPLIALTAEVYDENKHLDKDYFKHYLIKPVRAEDIYDVILVETGLKEASVINTYEQNDDIILTSEALSLLGGHEVIDISTRLLKKLNTRELGKLIEKVEFIAEMENNDSLREYTKELKLALETFNVYKIKQLLSLSTNNI